MRTLTLLATVLAIHATCFCADTEVSELSAEEAHRLIEGEEDVIVLDVRTPKEFAEGHLAGAHNIDFLADTFSSEVEKLDPEKTYLIHCRSGSRSGKSLAVFRELKFKKIYHLTSGYLGWVEAGNPVATE